MKKILFLAFVLTSYALTSYAEERVSIYSETCETIAKDETTSQARTRILDSAVFSAVEKLPGLELAQQAFDKYDFNMLVYNLIDNHIDDLNVKSSTSDKGKICVEITGSIKGHHILNAITETKKNGDERAKTREQNNLPTETYLETAEETYEKIMTEAGISPSGKVTKIAERDEAVEEVVITDENTGTFETTEEEIVEKTKIPTLYIAPTRFYDNSTSKKHSEVLKKLFTGNEYFSLTEDEKSANYNITPYILRVKIDAVNDQTSRMQMVIMLEMTDEENHTIKEHQNRFIMISSDEDEQEAAQKLMNKLLKNAGTNLLNKLETKERKNQNIKTFQIITPSLR